MKIGLLGLEFSIGNLGCEALSYSFVNELEKISESINVDFYYTAVVFADNAICEINGKSVNINLVKIKYKDISFWSKIRREFQECSVIFDFTMGDSFSDIYGFKRVFFANLVKECAINSGTKYILGPQTYGPYKNVFIRKWAKRIVKRSYEVFARDEVSAQTIGSITGRDIKLTTDIAFTLPFDKKEQNSKKIKIGFNPSGLLWFGGYERNNQFMLTVDYQKYCIAIMDYLTKSENYEVYLVPHVGTRVEDFEETYVENDGYICYLLKEKYPNLNIFYDINSAIDAKSYISSMDVFIGARMHATIGAFSAGVATIPFSYSMKFEGLFESLKYNNVIHGTSQTTEDAINQTIVYIENYKKLQKSVKESQKILEESKNDFRQTIKKIILEVCME